MPRERQEIFRESKTEEKEKIIVLAFEGNDTERIYFEELKSSEKFDNKLIYLHLLIRPKSDTKSAPNHVFNKLKKEAKDEYNFNKADELWMMIDRDRWKNIPDIISLCKKQKNMFVAGSNPCFELWLLLHVKNFSELSDDEKNKLLSNPKETNKKRYLDVYLSDILEDGYSKTNPKPERFIPLIETAVRQAKSLDKYNEDFPSDLGSHVYKIAEKLIKENKL
jgi:hypothetical protein